MARVFGTDCYTDALRAVRTECRNLDHDGKTRLALAFANCHLYKLGKRTHACSASMPLKACVNHKDPEFYFAHMQFFSEIDRCTCIAIASSLYNMSASSLASSSLLAMHTDANILRLG